MPNRNFPANTSCSEHLAKTPNVSPVDPTLVGHVFKVYADFAVFDTNTGLFVDPGQVTTKINGTTVRGLRQ